MLTTMRKSIITFVLVIVSVFIATNANADETWNNGTNISTAKTYTSNSTITINGTVTFSGSGCIRVNRGVTLTIKNGSTTAPATILINNTGTDPLIGYNDSGSGSSSIILQGNNASSCIIVDGNGKTVPAYVTTKGGDQNTQSFTSNYAEFKNFKSEYVFRTGWSTINQEYITLNNTTIKDCTVGSVIIVANEHGSKKSISATDCTISNCTSVDGVSGLGGEYGGLIRTVGGAGVYCDLTLTGCTFTGNTNQASNATGCVILYNAQKDGCKATVTNCTFSNNKVKQTRSDTGYTDSGRGGAVKIEGNMEFKNCTFTGNHSDNSGGAVAFTPYTYAGSKDITVNFDKDCSFTNNTSGKHGGAIYILSNQDGVNLTFNSSVSFSGNESAQDGGAVCFKKEKGTATINIQGGTIKNNTSGSNGGGIWSTGTSVQISNGVIQNNTAKNGGGLYINGGESCMSGGSILSNTATMSGGGMYVTGNGSFTFLNGEITGNHATGSGDNSNGGAIAIQKGDNTGDTMSLTISGGNIINNDCVGYGGGLWSKGTTVTITNGSFSENKACVSGGGIYLNGGGESSMSGGDIQYNTADKNGGGLFMTNGAVFTFTNGLIKKNNAQANGGGIYVKKSKLDFGTESIGIYGNIAGTSADDVFSEEEGGNVTLPDVSKMNLSGYDRKATSWMNDPVGNRYRKGYFETLPSGTYTTGVKAALGYPICGIIEIVKNGLKEKESAIFTIVKDGDTTPLYTVILTGVDNAGTAVTKTIQNVPVEKYTVSESDWSWAYNCAAPSHVYVVEEDKTTTYTFTNVPVDTGIIHSENAVFNSLSTAPASAISNNGNEIPAGEVKNNIF